MAETNEQEKTDVNKKTNEQVRLEKFNLKVGYYTNIVLLSASGVIVGGYVKDGLDVCLNPGVRIVSAAKPVSENVTVDSVTISATTNYSAKVFYDTTSLERNYNPKELVTHLQIQTYRPIGGVFENLPRSFDIGSTLLLSVLCGYAIYKKAGKKLSPIGPVIGEVVGDIVSSISAYKKKKHQDNK